MFFVYCNRYEKPSKIIEELKREDSTTNSIYMKKRIGNKLIKF